MDIIEVTWGRNSVSGTHSLWAEATKRIESLRRVEGSYRSAPMHKEASNVGVSSAIGLFVDLGPIDEDDNNRLERCLSDLILWVIQPELCREPRTILIQGPRLNKLVGRLGYRFPCSRHTIAWVTLGDAFHGGFVPSLCPEVEWDGPFPHVQEDSIIRSYVYKPEKLRVPLRVDLFVQGLNRYEPARQVGDTAFGFQAKLQKAQEAIVAFGKRLCDLSEIQRLENNKGQPFPSFNGRLEKRAARKTKRPQADGQRDQGYERSPDPASARPGITSGVASRQIFQSFIEHSTISISTRTGLDRYETFCRFVDSADGILVEDVKGFLVFIEQTIKVRCLKKTFVYDLALLNRWYEDYRAGELHDSMAP